MAELREKKVTMKIKLNNGVNDKGKPKYKNLSFKDINPAITEEQLYEFGTKIVNLQSLELNEIYKVQSEKVVQ